MAMNEVADVEKFKKELLEALVLFDPGQRVGTLLPDEMTDKQVEELAIWLWDNNCPTTYEIREGVRYISTRVPEILPNCLFRTV